MASGDLTLPEEVAEIIQRMSIGRRNGLLEALASYRASGPDDEAVLRRLLAFLDEPDPFRRSHSVGHVTASAVVARPTGDHFLLVFHRKLDRWLQPGGHVEADDDSVFAAALREAREETGIPRFESPIGDSILDLDVHAIPAHGNEPAHFHYDVRFLLTTGDACVPSPGAVWCSLVEVGAADRDGSLARATLKAALRLAAR